MWSFGRTVARRLLVWRLSLFQRVLPGAAEGSGAVHARGLRRHRCPRAARRCNAASARVRPARPAHAAAVAVAAAGAPAAAAAAAARAARAAAAPARAAAFGGGERLSREPTAGRHPDARGPQLDPQLRVSKILSVCLSVCQKTPPDLWYPRSPESSSTAVALARGAWVCCDMCRA